MNSPIVQALPFVFLIFFVLVWLAATTFLGLLSGWFSLMRKYPDRLEKPLFQLKRQSGSMGLGVGMRGVLNLAVCPSGLRVGIMKIFGIFSRDFLVPWENIAVRRRTQFFLPVAELTFGMPAAGRLILPSYVADKLARNSAGHWPEEGSFPPEPSYKAVWNEVKLWAIATALAALFFIVVPGIASPNAATLPIPVAILFPAVFFGIVALFRYYSRTRH